MDRGLTGDRRMSGAARLVASATEVGTHDCGSRCGGWRCSNYCRDSRWSCWRGGRFSCRTCCFRNCRPGHSARPCGRRAGRRAWSPIGWSWSSASSANRLATRLKISPVTPVAWVVLRQPSLPPRARHSCELADPIDVSQAPDPTGRFRRAWASSTAVRARSGC